MPNSKVMSNSAAIKNTHKTQLVFVILMQRSFAHRKLQVNENPKTYCLAFSTISLDGMNDFWGVLFEFPCLLASCWMDWMICCVCFTPILTAWQKSCCNMFSAAASIMTESLKRSFNFALRIFLMATIAIFHRLSYFFEVSNSKISSQMSID